jgi:hypothetical protein
LEIHKHDLIILVLSLSISFEKDGKVRRPERTTFTRNLKLRLASAHLPALLYRLNSILDNISIRGKGTSFASHFNCIIFIR